MKLSEHLVYEPMRQLFKLGKLSVYRFKMTKLRQNLLPSYFIMMILFSLIRVLGGGGGGGGILSMAMNWAQMLS